MSGSSQWDRETSEDTSLLKVTRVVFEVTSASGVRKSDDEVTVKVALGELGFSSCNVVTSVIGSSISRTMSIYLCSPKNFGGSTFLRGLDGPDWCLTGESFSGVLSIRIGFFRSALSSLHLAPPRLRVVLCSVDPVWLGVVE